MQIPDNIILSKRGSEIKIVADGYISITNKDDIYGISSREDTYSFCDEMSNYKVL